MKSVFGALTAFLLLSLFTPYFFKTVPFLSLPALSILLILFMRRDLQDIG